MNTQKQLVVTGVNYRKTALEIRNKFALTPEKIKSIYEEQNSDKQSDFFILSTCNRTEIYSLTETPTQVSELLHKSSKAEYSETKNYTFIKEGDEAIKHLFEVASGLDSQILGDYEIIGQLKNAFSLSKEHHSVSGYMEKLVNASLQASRQVRNKTSVSNGTTSVSYAVIQLMKKELADKSGMTICLMGLGKIGTLTLKNLKSYLPQHNIIIVNRDESKAEAAAKEYGVEFAKFDNHREVLQNADVLVVATGADYHLVTTKHIETTKIKLLFDLSVPSNVCPDVKEVEGLKFYEVDNLSKIVNETLEHRKEDIPQALQIIDEHIAEFKEWEKRRKIYIAAKAN